LGGFLIHATPDDLISLTVRHPGKVYFRLISDNRETAVRNWTLSVNRGPPVAVSRARQAVHFFLTYFCCEEDMLTLR